MGRRHACTPCRHLGARTSCPKSCPTPCHQKSTRAARAGNCLRTLCMAPGRAGPCWRSAKASMASTPACNRLSTCADVCGSEVEMSNGWKVSARVAKCCRYALWTSWHRCTSARVVSQVTWDLAVIQMPCEPLLNVFEFLVRLSQAPANGQRIALDDLMDDVKAIRHTQALQAFFGQLDEGVGPITDHVQDLRSQS